MNSNRAVFLDRDGVINVDHGYVSTWEAFEFLPGVPEALRVLQRAGYLLVVVSNQSGIGRGFYSESDVNRLNSQIRAVLTDWEVTVAGFYHCPHHPTEALEPYRIQCDCRKPAPGMILQACRNLKIEAAESVLVGDKRTDIEAGIAAGIGRLFWISNATASEGIDVISGLPDVATALGY